MTNKPMSKTKFGEQYYCGHYLNKNFLRRLARDKLNLSPKSRPLFRILRQLPDGARVLDAGCGVGGFLELVERSCPSLETWGIDIGAPPVFRSKGRFIRGSVEQLPFPDQYFSMVHCAHVIEHLPDPFIAIKEMVRVCRPGGYCYVEAPSQRAALMPFGHSFWDDPTHVRPYSTRAIVRLMEGFDIDLVSHGVRTSIPAIVLGLPYMVIGRFLGDQAATVPFLEYTFGHNSYCLGRRRG